MDDYMFRQHVEGCKNVIEATSYLEILNYTVSFAKLLPRSSYAPVDGAFVLAQRLLLSSS